VISVVTQVDLTSWVSQLRSSEDKPIDFSNPRFAQPAEQVFNGEHWALASVLCVSLRSFQAVPDHLHLLTCG
jgi:hypothetical protein